MSNKSVTIKTLLKDTFEYHRVPFLVTVEERYVYVNPKYFKNGLINKNKKGPQMFSWMERRGWKRCRCNFARVRPDYPYNIRKEWPENVPQHFKTIELLEKHKRKLPFWWVKKPQDPEYTPQELAQLTITKLKKAYENRDKVESLNQNPASSK